jgi:hypothetical protein
VELATVAVGEVVVLTAAVGAGDTGVVTVAESTFDVTFGAPAALVVAAGISLGTTLVFGG